MARRWQNKNENNRKKQPKSIQDSLHPSSEKTSQNRRNQRRSSPRLPRWSESFQKPSKPKQGEMGSVVQFPRASQQFSLKSKWAAWTAKLFNRKQSPDEPQESLSQPLAQSSSSQSSAGKTIKGSSSRRMRQSRRNALTAASGRQEYSAISSSVGKVSRRSKSRIPKPILYGVRLLILGVGLGALAGSVFSILDPGNGNLAELQVSQVLESSEELSVSKLSLQEEILPLKEEVQDVMSQYTDLEPGVFIIDLDDGSYLDLAGQESFAAASTIKVPILMAFWEEVDQGKIRLDEMLTMEESMVATGSGNMQYETPGKQFSTLETIEKMIIISDNTATNMIVERLGGAEVLNERFQSWGLEHTGLNNILPDIEGFNTSSPKDLVKTLALIEQGEVLSVRSRDRLLHIMEQTKNRSLLPQGLSNNSIIAHKTGTIGKLVADVGLVDLKNGKRYIIAVMVKRPHSDLRGKSLIQQISRVTHQYFEQFSTPSTSTDDLSEIENVE